jgi:hypothetical protein
LTVAAAIGAATAAPLALATAPATATEPADPVVVLYTEMMRLRAAAEAAQDRADAIRTQHAIPDCYLPQVDRSRPEFSDAPWPDGHHLQFKHLSDFNVQMLCAGSACDTPKETMRALLHDIQARTEWWHAELDRLDRVREETGYSAAVEETEDLWDQAVNLEKVIAETPPTTLAGAILRVKVAALILRDERRDEGEMDISDRLLVRAANDFERLAGGEPT